MGAYPFLSFQGDVGVSGFPYLPFESSFLWLKMQFQEITQGCMPILLQSCTYGLWNVAPVSLGQLVSLKSVMICIHDWPCRDERQSGSPTLFRNWKAFRPQLLNMATSSSSFPGLTLSFCNFDRQDASRMMLRTTARGKTTALNMPNFPNI